MLPRVLTGIVNYGLMGVFVFLLARMSIRHEMSKHPDPPYRVALSFLKTMYSLGQWPTSLWSLSASLCCRSLEDKCVAKVPMQQNQRGPALGAPLAL